MEKESAHTLIAVNPGTSVIRSQEQQRKYILQEFLLLSFENGFSFRAF